MNRIFATISLMIAVAMFFAYVKPMWSGTIAETKLAIKSNERALLAAKEYKREQAALTEQKNAIDPAGLEKLLVFLPDSVDNVGLILDINALAARSGLALSNIDVLNTSGQGALQGTTDSGSLPVASANPIGSVDLTLTALGTYSALQSFLTGIERSARVLDVRDIEVQGSETGVYNYHMTIRLYWLR